MLILGIDTSGQDGSIALVRIDGGSPHTVELAPIEGGTFSAQLIPQLSRILSSNGATRGNIDAFAIVSGPGSFTGLRVGLAAVKALAETLQKPIAVVSLLELIAFEQVSARPELKRSSNLLVALDARRNEVFLGDYDVSGEMPARVSESLRTMPELIDLAAAGTIFTPHANIIENLRSHTANQMNVVQVGRPDAASVARLGFRKIQRDDVVLPLDLDATYIRRSDAEINSATSK